MPLFAMVAQTKRTESTDSLLPLMQSLLWTTKKSTASNFTAVQPKLKPSVKKTFNMNLKNTRTLRRDAIYLLRALHLKQLSKNYSNCLLSSVKSNHLKSQQNMTTALMPLSALRHLTQQLKLKPKAS